MICLRHWLQCVQDEGTGTRIPYHESDRVVKAIAQGINALYQQVDGAESELTGTRLEQEIIDAVPWIWWKNFPPIEFQGHRLFEPTTAQGWIESSVHGGSNFNEACPRQASRRGRMKTLHYRDCLISCYAIHLCKEIAKAEIT